jgi:hypothetical protein
MARGILYVETTPNSPEDLAAYHEWYNGTHVKEILAVDGFVSARRFEPVGHDGPFIAIYEIEDDDIEVVRDRLAEAARTVPHTTPVGVRLDPPPTVRYFQEIASAP